MRYILISLFFLTLSCNKQKSVLICGDHKCINKAEAKQYFEDNLTIEVQIISKNKTSSYDLVDINLSGDEQDIKIFKNKQKKIVKKLSKEEIKEKKAELKRKKKKKNSFNEIKEIKKDATKKSKKSVKVKNITNIDNNSLDICFNLKKCDIDSITNYLIKSSNEKDFPNISTKE